MFLGPHETLGTQKIPWVGNPLFGAPLVDGTKDINLSPGTLILSQVYPNSLCCC